MKQRRKIIFLTIILVIFASFSVFAWPIPDSGQTKCYDTYIEIPCPSLGEAFYGQDGNYTINSQSYTKLDANGNDLSDSATDWVMVRDNVTGLIWEVKQNKDDVQNYSNPHDADNEYTWYDSNSETNGGNAGTPGNGTDTEDFINALNTEGFGGHNDWRLPTIKELASIANLGVSNPAINGEYFSDTNFSIYWSSTPDAGQTSNAWGTGFDGGYNRSCDKSSSYYVRAVREGLSQSFENLIINNDGTVTDSNTGLMWQQDTGDDMAWKDALSDCESLFFSGYSDWRLPTKEEFHSIIDYEKYSPAINTMYFSDTRSLAYWSSTTYAYGTYDAWSMGFDSGDDYGNRKSYIYFFRAVRGGQNRLSGHLFIQEPKQASKWNGKSSMPITWETNSIPGDVKISISYQGGKEGTFETIIENTPNDGLYEWIVKERLSYNCVLKIEPLSDPTKSTTQGLFCIVGKVNISPLNVVVNEPGSTEPNTSTFNIALSAPPQTGTDVTIELTATNPGECSIFPTTVTLDDSTWNTGHDVTVTGIADNIVDGDQVTAILTSKVVSDDAGFDGLNIANIMVMVKDDSTGITVDSVYPSYGPETQDMNVIIKGYGFDSSTQVSIYQTGNPEISATTTFISDTILTATLPGQSAGEYNLKVNRSGVIAEIKNGLEFYQVSAVSNKKAIIVSGSGPYNDNDMWTSTRKCTDMAYHTLYSQGYLKDDIQYLSMQGVDVTGNGEADTDDVATSEKLQTAIETWASDANLAELILYMVGPGGNGIFQFKSDQNPQYLTPANLDTWLDTLQTTATNAKIIVIYDACQSGSFLHALSGTSRIIIAGSQANERAWFLDDGEISFSWFFWNGIYSNAEIYEAFDNAKTRLAFMQTPILDDHSGSLRRGTRSTDPEVVIGRGRTMTLTLPTIETLSFDPTYLDGTSSATITAGNVHDTNGSGMSRVWARILPPVDVVTLHNIPVLTVPTVSLEPVNDNFTSSYEDFDKAGGYKVFVHAIDKMGLTAFPKYSLFKQLDGQGLSPGDFNIDMEVDLKDALVALQIACGFSISTTIDADVTDDDKIGVPDALWIIRKVAGLKDKR